MRVTCSIPRPVFDELVRHERVTGTHRCQILAWLVTEGLIGGGVDRELRSMNGAEPPLRTTLFAATRAAKPKTAKLRRITHWFYCKLALFGVLHDKFQRWPLRGSTWKYEVIKQAQYGADLVLVRNMAEKSDKDQYFDDLRSKMEKYTNGALKRYNWPTKVSCWIFRITGTLIILSSVSLPYLITTEWPKPFISAVSLLVALLTALNSFWGWQLRWQRGVAAKAALENYIANWEIGMLEAKKRPDYVEKARDVTSYLYTHVFAAVKSELEAFFEQVKSPSGAPEKQEPQPGHAGPGPGPTGQ